MLKRAPRTSPSPRRTVDSESQVKQDNCPLGLSGLGRCPSSTFRTCDILFPLCGERCVATLRFEAAMATPPETLSRHQPSDDPDITQNDPSSHNLTGAARQEEVHVNVVRTALQREQARALVRNLRPPFPTRRGALQTRPYPGLVPVARPPPIHQGRSGPQVASLAQGSHPSASNTLGHLPPPPTRLIKPFSTPTQQTPTPHPNGQA